MGMCCAGAERAGMREYFAAAPVDALDWLRQQALAVLLSRYAHELRWWLAKVKIFISDCMDLLFSLAAVWILKFWGHYAKAMMQNSHSQEE